MKKIEYICDLCREVKPKESVYKYWWGWNAPKSKQTYHVRDINDSTECDKHICFDCLNVVGNFAVAQIHEQNKCPAH